MCAERGLLWPGMEEGKLVGALDPCFLSGSVQLRLAVHVGGEKPDARLTLLSSEFVFSFYQRTEL